jgi:succinyl-CoA synthetase beta subunit
MWVTEHASKLLLDEVGVVVPDGVACSCDEAPGEALKLGLPLYVKALLPIKDRASRGAVRRVRDAPELEAAIGRCRELGARRVRLEREVATSSWWYLAVGWFPPDERPRALFSEQGGTGIELRPDAITSVEIDPEIGPLPYHVRALTRRAPKAAGAQSALLDLLRRCFGLLWTKDATLVELNPVGLVDGTPVAIDARIVVDESSRAHEDDPRLAAVHDGAGAGVAEDLADHGIVYVPLDGSVGVAGLGAGMTLHLADWVALQGGQPAFFFDATEAAVRDWRAMFAGEVPARFAEVLRYGLERALPSARSLLINFTSGGTPVDALTKGLLSAWEKGIDWQGGLVVHVAGNRGDAARRLLIEAGLDPAPTLAEGVRRAVDLARPIPRAAAG